MIKAISTFLIFTSFLFSFSVIAQDEIKFKLVYSPKIKKGCKAVSNRFIYVNSDGRYRFKLAFNKQSLPEEFTKPGKRQNDLEVRIYSFKGLVEKQVPLKVVSFRSIMSWVQNTTNGFSSKPVFPINLKAPKFTRNSHASNYSSAEFQNWNLIAVFYDKKTNSALATSSYNLKLIPSSYNIYSKIENSSVFYSLPATPITKLFDNYNGSTALHLAHDANLASQNGTSERFSRGIYLGLSFDSDLTLSMMDTSYDYGDFADDFYGSSLSGLSMGFSASFMMHRTKEVSRVIFDGVAESVENFFSLAPGESGMVFSQIHVEQSDYIVLAPNRCGELSEKEVKNIELVHFSYHLVPLDRTRFSSLEYLTMMADEYVPTYYYK